MYEDMAVRCRRGLQTSQQTKKWQSVAHLIDTNRVIQSITVYDL